MSRTARYAAACSAVVAGGSAVAAAFVDRTALFGVLAAAAVALPIQIVAFGALAGTRIGTNRFLLAWFGGTLVRLLVVGLGGWALVAAARLPALPTLLSLAGFFFVMLLLEPTFLGLGRTGQTGARGNA